MKKFLKSRWFVALLGVVVFIITFVVLILTSIKPMIQAELDKSGMAQQAKKELAAVEAEKAKQPETLENAGKTAESEAHKKNKPEAERTIARHFSDLERVTAAGDLKATHPSLREVIQQLQARQRYLNQREAELEDLSSHLNEQLKELHFHTNHITLTRSHLDKLLEGKVDLIRQNETNKLMQMAQIYGTIMNTGDAEARAENLRNLIRATQEEDPTLNPKVFQYMVQTNQATIVNALISSGDPEDVKLYNTLIKSWRKPMLDPGLTPTPTP